MELFNFSPIFFDLKNNFERAIENFMLIQLEDGKFGRK
jgi:hypothetical protein